MAGKSGKWELFDAEQTYESLPGPPSEADRARVRAMVEKHGPDVRHYFGDEI